jgi:hypothetical protein
MSNEYEFKVHNFYNYTLEELPKLKEEFEASVNSFKSMYEQTVNFKEAQADLNKLTKDEWYKKHDCVEDSKIYEMAEKEYGKCSK